ncbi:30S ribosomal protein S11 [Candidatus Campbellbacteria bacterium CG11_big_fil_rev_8_21_14_0_20_44_21]|uniref:Small ribosomal subunit protein uS11 n=1 Tax=Candidatus Campbellbacteria bacterium CG22_combo_CG10-13_8_21_14_all_43_18 TaxID=1974530 RepID=A0A2H0DX49_9BACT|nr:MAG: 30S ribosomal protein S11 [Candidatus Campbellbacteria bacterium CG22_combo_CG10-13_8_21_14_all_43_18]PIR24438.1 MAG: 30S ribosomal protein S11 [Candidatus Campbellbacteria bacterium CG11_big_fil_rev_8_21_14_0_20_44_21]
MGKKRIIKKTGGEQNKDPKAVALSKLPRKKMETGILHVRASYNNTRVMLTDLKGGVVAWSSSGALGFKGAKKGTPFAAAQVGDVIGEKAKLMGLKEVEVVIKGVGSGRESSVRSFTGKGINLKSIRDETPIPHGGPKPKKPRKV